MMLTCKIAGGILALACGACQPAPTDHPAAAIAAPTLPDVIASPDIPRPPFTFASADDAFLDEVAHGAFNFMWHSGDKPNTLGMTPDRTSKPEISIAGVGYQLSAIIIGVERGWITREAGEERTLRILRGLAANPANRKAGLFYHFLDPKTAGQPGQAYEHVVSTIDSALFFAGVITSSQYFGGEIQTIGDQLVRDADWTFFRCSTSKNPEDNGFLSLGWQPANLSKPTGDGHVLPYAWVDNGDEHRLVTFLAVCAPEPAHRVDGATYYKLRRTLGKYKDGQPFVWFPWSGAMFVSQFSHCWIDYSAIGPDDPAAFGIPCRSRVDWWENSRRTMEMQRQKAIDHPEKGLSESLWGLTASDVAKGYAVPGLFPTRIDMPGCEVGRDYPKEAGKDNYGDGTIAPYGAGSSIMFDAVKPLESLKYIRSLRETKKLDKLWEDPATGGYGLADAFNLKTGWIAPDHLAIDQGPLLIAIENARTGLIWKTFHAHPFVKAGMERLKLSVNEKLPPAAPK
ncbi:MAG: glucoamylase family protein [Phycisphaerales bacterium]|jgi:hypothetical protein